MLSLEPSLLNPNFKDPVTGIRGSESVLKGQTSLSVLSSQQHLPGHIALSFPDGENHLDHLLRVQMPKIILCFSKLEIQNFSLFFFFD